MPDPVDADFGADVDVSDFSLGVVLANAFSVLIKHPFVFIGLTFLAQVPGVIVVVLMAARRPGLVLTPELERIAGALNLVFGLVIQGAVAYGVYESLMGRGVGLVKSVWRGLSRIFSLILGLLCCCVFMMLPMIGIIVVIGIFRPGELTTSVLVGACCVVMVLVLWSKWCIFVPACAVERLGPIRCLNRSSELTKGCRLKICGLYLLGFMFAFAVSFGVNLFYRPFFLFVFNLDAFMYLADKFGPLPGLVAVSAVPQLFMAVPTALLHIMTSVIYYGLREVKEGVSVEHLVDVFE